jgi:hypothetical protein
VTVDKDCTGKAFTDNCFDTTTLFGSGWGFAFTLLTPDTLPAEGATMDIFRNFDSTEPYDSPGQKITITVGRNTWSTTPPPPPPPPPTPTPTPTPGGTDKPRKWY